MIIFLNYIIKKYLFVNRGNGNILPPPQKKVLFV